MRAFLLPFTIAAALVIPSADLFERESTTSVVVSTDGAPTSQTTADATWSLQPEAPVLASAPAVTALPAQPSPEAVVASPRPAVDEGVADEHRSPVADPTHATPTARPVEARVNQPMRLMIDPVEGAVVGAPVVVSVYAEDPDAEITMNGGWWWFDDPYTTEPQLGPATVIVREPLGDVRPEPGSLHLTATHTFNQPGEYTFSVNLTSGPSPRTVDAHPYASNAGASITILVAPATEAE